jgi:hypothetical protein
MIHTHGPFVRRPASAANGAGAAAGGARTAGAAGGSSGAGAAGGRGGSGGGGQQPRPSAGRAWYEHHPPGEAASQYSDADDSDTDAYW